MLQHFKPNSTGKVNASDDHLLIRFHPCNLMHFPNKGLGRIGIFAFTLGYILSMHFAALCLMCLQMNGMASIVFLDQLESSRIFFISQWIGYVITLCIFHLAEFFVTCIYNPLIVTSDSFLINHSTSYTVAILVRDYVKIGVLTRQ